MTSSLPGEGTTQTEGLTPPRSAVPDPGLTAARPHGPRCPSPL